MIDEHFMRNWNAGHVRFSADVDRALDKIGRLLGTRSGKDPIGAAYARKPAKTLVSGLAAVATTMKPNRGVNRSRTNLPRSPSV